MSVHLCPSASNTTPLRECALRHGLSEELIEKIESAAKLAGVDIERPLVESRLNAQHLIGCKMGFSPEDVLSDWFTPMHRCAAEEGASIEELRGATEPEAYGIFHGLSRIEVNGLPKEQIYEAADRKDCHKLVAYAIDYGLSLNEFANITTTAQFHERIDRIAEITYEDHMNAENRNLTTPSPAIDPVRVKMVKAGLGNFNPPSFYSRGWQ